MTRPASVIVPTHDRPRAVRETVSHCLASARRAGGEVVVVDDGSSPPLRLETQPDLRVVRTPGVERSRARNQGATNAHGELLIFVDDDITVGADFVAQHVRAAAEFADVISVGRISLPREADDSAFGRFRRSIEEPGQARARGFVVEGNFCTAANMSIRKKTFLSLGGFDPAILSGEDQDLALRFTTAGGRIVYLPEAEVIHRDAVADIAAYGRRHEWGARALAPFLRRYPARPENVSRLREGLALGNARWPDEASRVVTRSALSRPWPLAFIRGLTGVAERWGAGDGILFPLYRSLLGLHLFRGFRAGLESVPTAPPLPSPLTTSHASGETD